MDSSDKDYIGVIREKNGVLCYCEEPIRQEDILITEIEAMKENDNRTLMDVQQRFVRDFPLDCFKADGYSVFWPNGYYNYLYPNSYNSAYVNGAGYPKLLTYDEYKEALRIRERDLRYDYILSVGAQNSLKLIRNKSESDYQKTIAEYEKKIAEEVMEYRNKMRKAFYYKPFIFAHNYKIKLREILQQDDVRMYSTDQIGWKEFEYKVNEDINIYMKTNFGYGSASYFFCNLKYKGINILPYTAPIEYYYVQWTDLIRFTRQYDEERESWLQVFDFVVETANLAKIAPEQFVKKWILNELDEMIKGLIKIVTSPKNMIKKYLREENKSIRNGYRMVRNCSTRDIQEYEILPNEKTMAVKAEKITGSLLLLENLRKLVVISSVVNEYISIIEELNRYIKPEIDEFIKKLESDISKLVERLNQIQKELENVIKLVANHEQSIRNMMEIMNKGRGYGNIYSIEEVMNTYSKENPQYHKDLSQKKTLESKKAELEKDIKLRSNFLNILMNCKNRIQVCLKVA